MPYFDRPARLCAVAAAGVRIAAGLQGLSQNPLLSNRQLDSQYYVDWAREIAAGDLAGTRGIAARSPYILNPLYAYVLAPIVGIGSDPALPVIVLQAALAAATTALTVVAARRFFGRGAAWTAGIAVAFSTALVQLDTHVAVSGLAALLTAGAVFASAAPREGASGRGHGALAKGLWLGVGALARPITPLALPFYLWHEWKSAASRRLAGVAVLAGAFGACALPSLVRNWAVAGEPVVYTSASGLNLHIGNNPDSRKFRTMVSQYTTFEPRQMHVDAHDYVASVKGGDPTASQVSSFFTHVAIEELTRAPGDSAVFYLNKLRWFWSPAEPPSTASLANDLRFTPILRIAFVPTWLLAAAALIGVIAHRRRRDVLCGPGALAVAHVAVLTLVFPLSHYRSPAIPALAVLAGGAVEAAAAAWRRGAHRVPAVIAAGVAAVATIGSIGPQPARMREADALLLAFDCRDRKQFDAGAAYAEEAIRVFREDWPDETDRPTPFIVLGEIEARRGRYAESLAAFERGLTLRPQGQPDNWRARLERSRVAQSAGRLDLAESDARTVALDRPEIAIAHARLGEVLVLTSRIDEARREFSVAIEIDPGVHIDPDARLRVR